MKKRVIILLSLLMCLILAVSVSAAVVDSGVCGDNLTWTFDDNGTLTISGTGDMYNWSSDSPYSEDYAPWLSYRRSTNKINKVVIESGVTSIGRDTFSTDYFYIEVWEEYIDGIESIVLPDSVTKIGEDAFKGCNSLTNVEIPDSVTSIDRYAFNRCENLESIKIGNSVASIGSGAFGNCTSLEKIFVPNSVTSLEPYASSFSGISNGDGTFTVVPNYSQNAFGGIVFENCTNLESITVDANNKMYSSDENGVLFNKDKTVLIKYPIGNKATSYKIPDGVTIIGRAAFEGSSNLKSIIIPDSITTIGSYAFSDCTNLEVVEIPDKEISFDNDVFDNCPLLENALIYENNGNYSSDENGVLFSKDKTVLIRYPAGNKATSYVIPDSVTSIEGDAFSGCTSLETIVIPYGVTSIGDSAFEDCINLKSIFIPDSVTEIGFGAFYDCTSLKSVILGNGVTRIHMEAFAHCTSLEEIVIPKSVTEIGEFSFNFCTSLKKATVLSKNAKFHFGMEEVFNRSNPVIYGYKGSTAEAEADKDNRPFIALPEESTEKSDISVATPTSAKALINGKEVAFTAYNIGGNNYFKLRDVAMALSGSEKNFNVGWDGENNAISLTSNQNYIPVGGELVIDANAASTEPIVTNSRVYKDGEPVSFIAFNIVGNNYFKLRDIGKAFDFGIGWDNETKTITVDTSISYTE